MKTVQFKDLKLIKQCYSSGNFSNVHIVSLDGITYCFKEFKNILDYPAEIKNNICNFTKLPFNKDFLFPQFIVLKRNNILGYLTYFDKNNKNIYSLDLCYEDKIKLLKNVKKKIQMLHKNYKLIHGDLNVQNILSSKDLNTSLIDFDSTLRFDQEIVSTVSFSMVLKDYLKCYKFDKNADIYRFNISTFKFLNDLQSDESVLQLLNLGLLDENKYLKKLNKELLLLPESRKSKYSGEFVIDYIK